MDNAASNFPNSANGGGSGGEEGPHEHFIRTRVDDVAQGRCSPCDLFDFPPLCHSEAPLPLDRGLKSPASRHQSHASSCYLDNCQQEKAFFFSSLSLLQDDTVMFLINNFTHLAAARRRCRRRGGVRMPIIFTVCCAEAIGERQSACDCPDRGWQHPEPEIPANRLDTAAPSEGGSRVRWRPPTRRDAEVER